MVGVLEVVGLATTAFTGAQKAGGLGNILVIIKRTSSTVRIPFVPCEAHVVWRNCMSKEELIDIILKAAAIYLIVLAVIALPDVVAALINISLLARTALETLTGDATIGQTIMATGISASITGVTKFVLYIIVARNLFSVGSWFKWILGKTEPSQ